jgi:cyclic pyranopterin phosphate synthase
MEDNSKYNLTHLDKNSMPKMVDVGDKEKSKRVATASGEIYMSKEAFDVIVSNSAKKGPVLQTAIIASIMGAKKTSEIIPMCHPININSVNCETSELVDGFRLEVTAKTDEKTGIEMEVLTAVSIGLLTIYDMIKAIDKSMTITNVKLNYKSGGKSGEFING